MATTEACITKESKGLGFFEKYLTVWVILCILLGIALGKLAPQVAKFLDGLAVTVDGAPIVSIPIAVIIYVLQETILEVGSQGKTVRACSWEKDTSGGAALTVRSRKIE